MISKKQTYEIFLEKYRSQESFNGAKRFHHNYLTFVTFSTGKTSFFYDKKKDPNNVLPNVTNHLEVTIPGVV